MRPHRFCHACGALLIRHAYLTEDGKANLCGPCSNPLRPRKKKEGASR